MALIESWQTEDLDYFTYEVNNHAVPPRNTGDNNFGRNAGGTVLSSEFPAYRDKKVPGLTKFICQGIYFLAIYFNEYGLANKD